MPSGRATTFLDVLDDRTYSAQEIADQLGIAEKTVRRWIESGKLPAERIGRRFAVKMDAARRVYAESRSGRAAGRGVEAESEVRRLEAELAVMQGRYQELQLLVGRLETALADERRKNAALELRMELRAAA